LLALEGVAAAISLLPFPEGIDQFSVIKTSPVWKAEVGPRLGPKLVSRLTPEAGTSSSMLVEGASETMAD
jgi:hypothetical protein